MRTIKLFSLWVAASAVILNLGLVVAREIAPLANFQVRVLDGITEKLDRIERR